MGLLARALKHKSVGQGHKQSLISSAGKHQLVGLLGRAQKLRHVPEKLGLLRQAERLRKEIETNLGLRARAEGFRSAESLSQEGSLTPQEVSASIEPSVLQTNLRPKARLEIDQGAAVVPIKTSKKGSFGKAILPKSLKTQHAAPPLSSKAVEETNPDLEVPAFLQSMEREGSARKLGWESIPSFSSSVSSTLSPSEADSIPKTATQLSKRLEQYQVVFDIFKELQNNRDLNTFWDALCHAVVSELGAQSVLVFSETEQSKYSSCLYSSHHSGLSSLPKVRLKQNKGLLEYFSQQNQACHVKNIHRDRLNMGDKKILKELNTKAIFTLSQKDAICAVLFVGPSISESPYSDDDLYFLQLLSELSLGRFLELKEQSQYPIIKQEVQLELEHYKGLFHLAHRAANLNKLEDMYSLLSEYMEYYLSASIYSLILLSLEEKHYYMFRAKGLSEESQKKYRLRISSNLIGSISNLVRIYHLDDFKKNSEIKDLYSPEDMKVMGNYWILPLIHSHCLIGYISIHKMRNFTWTALEHELALSLAEIITPYLLNTMIGELEELPRLLKDPFVGLRERLEYELIRAQEQSSPLSILDLRIQNIKAVSENMETKNIAVLFSQITQTLAKFLNQDDYLNRLELGHFAIVLPQKNISESKKWLKELDAKLPKKIPAVKNKNMSFSKKLNYSFNLISPLPAKAEIQKILKIFS